MPAAASAARTEGGCAIDLVRDITPRAEMNGVSLDVSDGLYMV